MRETMMLLRGAVLGMAVLAGCTTIPSRFNTFDAIAPGCGYLVDAEDANGFSLEVAYKEYKFFPSPDPVIVAARACFSQVATELARRKGRKIVAPAVADMNTAAHRNITDAQYLVNVAGRVRYAIP